MLTFAKHKKAGSEPVFKATYIDGKWYAKKDKLYYIPMFQDYLNRVDVVFSLPTNDYYPVWTPKRHPRTSTRLEIGTLYWAPIKEDIVIHGELIDNIPDNTPYFIIDWKRQNLTNIGEFNKYNDKLYRLSKQTF